MASVRVEQVLGQIAELSDEEQGELLTRLPRVLHAAANSAGLSTDAVRLAIVTRERIQRRLADIGASAGSINADLDEVREGRLDDIAVEGMPQDLPQ
jgi:hypothetical protein